MSMYNKILNQNEDRIWSHRVRILVSTHFCLYKHIYLLKPGPDDEVVSRRSDTSQMNPNDLERFDLHLRSYRHTITNLL